MPNNGTARLNGPTLCSTIGHLPTQSESCNGNKALLVLCLCPDRCLFCVLVRWVTLSRWPRSTWTASGRVSVKANGVTSPSPTSDCWNNHILTMRAEGLTWNVPSPAPVFLSRSQRKQKKKILQAQKHLNSRAKMFETLRTLWMWFQSLHCAKTDVGSPSPLEPAVFSLIS